MPDLCIIAKKRRKKQNPNTTSILLTYVETALEGHKKDGRGGIRTPVTRKGDSVFKTDAFSRSATLPWTLIYNLLAQKDQVLILL